MKSHMQFSFANVPAPKIGRSAFQRDSQHKTTFDEGNLVPIYLDEVLPGDTMSMQWTVLCRMLSMIYPIMDNVFLDMFWFFVPMRLLWSNFEKFMGSQTNPGDSTDYTIPILSRSDTTGVGIGTIFDYFGLPSFNESGAIDTNISALPFRAYNLIWNQWFRDENLQNSLSVPLTDGPDLYNLYTLKKRGKRFDYFTGCLPAPQKGTSVSLPLGSTAPVIGNGKTIGMTDGTNNLGLFYTDDAGFQGVMRSSTGNFNTNQGTYSATGFISGDKTVGLTTNAAASGLIADLSSASAATINQFRTAMAYQSILERDMRGGTRYTEMIRAHFGVINPDFRLQRPEYLGGSSQRINVSQVVQTSATGATGTPQGNVAAFGIGTNQHGFHKSFTEHGYVIGLVNVRADITYQQQLDKLWFRRTRFDFYLPSLAHLGEQAVLNKEIMFAGAPGTDELVFGYNERWAELRYKKSMVTGVFRSIATGTLHAWHLATNFGGFTPVLNDDFIQDAPPISRVVAVTNEPHFLMDSYFKLRHVRPLPTYSTPASLGRF
jgi:hypothetical protein